MSPLESIRAKPGARCPGSTANRAVAHINVARRNRITTTLSCAREGLQRLLVRRARDSALGDDGADIAVGGHVEGGILDRCSRRRDRVAEDVSDLGGSA